MEGSHRNRSYSVPILSQIEKVLDRAEDFGVERRTKEGSRFPETRSLRNITRPKVRLSSGGLIRKQKRRYSKAVMESTESGSPTHEQQHEQNEQARPRAFTTSVIDVNAVNNLDPVLPAIESSEKVCDTAEPQPSVPVRRKRCKSLPFVISEDNSQSKINDGNNRADKIGCGALPVNREQTATSEEFSREEELFRQRVSLPASLQEYEIENSDKDSHKKMTDIAISSTLDFTNLDKPNSLITDFEKLSMIKLKHSQKDMETFLGDFGRRRRSLPCYLEPNIIFTEPSVEKNIFDADFRVDSASQKTMKTKARRSQSLPLTSSCFVGEVRVPLKDKEYSNSAANCPDGEYGFRQTLEHTEKSNERSRQRKMSRKTRSKSLPLVLDEETKANMSPLKLTKHAKQSGSLQSHDSSHNFKVKTRRTRSLPFIYEGFTERELLLDVQDTQVKSSDSGDDNERKISNERKQLYSNGSIKQSAQLERARSLPVRVAGGKHRQTSDIQKDLNKAIDIFFSQICDKDNNVGLKGRSKSLPTVLEGEHGFNFTPVAQINILEADKRNIPEIVIAEGNFYETAGSEECESLLNKENMPSHSEEEKITYEESNSDASSDCDELESQISNAAYAHDPPLVARPRGFSIPSSFKMEKIPEEPNENENCETLSSCEHGGTENFTNCVCKDRLNETMDCTAPVENLNVSEEEKDTLVDQSVDDEEGSTQCTTELKRQSNNHEHNLEIFNEMITEFSSRVRQLEFAKSSSCLHRAAAKGDLEHVKLLVEEGNDVNALDESGWPVLHAAVTTGNFDCCAWLIDAGADLLGYTDFVIEEYRMLCRQVYLNH